MRLQRFLWPKKSPWRTSKPSSFLYSKIWGLKWFHFDVLKKISFDRILKTHAESGWWNSNFQISRIYSYLQTKSNLYFYLSVILKETLQCETPCMCKIWKNTTDSLQPPQPILVVYITGLRAPLSLIYVTLVEHSCVLLLTFSLSFYYFTNLELRTMKLM